jgi:hypothetical protein
MIDGQICFAALDGVTKIVKARLYCSIKLLKNLLSLVIFGGMRTIAK